MIRFADELVCPLHKALPLLETLNFIDQLFGNVRVIAKNDQVSSEAFQCSSGDGVTDIG